MRKKKEFPRKHKRVVKKIILISVVLCTTLVLSAGGLYYFFVLRTQMPHSVLGEHTHILTSEASDVFYSQLQEGLEKDQINYTTLTKGNDLYVLTLQNGGKVTFSSQKDIMMQIASLQYILSHLTMEGREFSSLDLRFDQPVIVIKP